MSQIDDFLSGKPTQQAPQTIDDFLGAQPKKKRGITDVLSDAGTAVWEGAKSTARSMGAAGNTFSGDLADVEDYALRQQLAQEKRPEAVKALTAEIERRKQANPDGGVVDAIRDVGGAMIDNPEGSAQFVIEQAPNSAVALGAGWAGAKLGAAGGSLLGPVGAVVGGVGGFLGGMFLGNTLLETGGKSIEKAEGGFTEAERGEAIKEGAVKGGVITAVDAATLGAGNLVSKSLGKAAINAGARAEARVLADAGVDLTSRAAIEAALAKNPALRTAAKSAGEAAAKAASTMGSKAAMAGTGLTMETVGEGTGEYLGELAATGKGDVYDAVMESAAGLSQSVPEVAWNMRQASSNELNAKNIARQGIGLQGTPPAITPETGNTPTSQGAPAITPQSADPTARLAELEILAEQRDLTPVERQEAADLLTALNNEQDAPQGTEGIAPEAAAVEAPEATGGDGAAVDGVPAEPAAPELEAAGVEPADVPVSVDATGKQASWVIRDKATGEAVMETFDPAKVQALNRDKYEAVPIAEHLASLNRPKQPPTDFWSFAKSKGFTPGQIKVGTPEHAALKAEYDALKAPEPILPPMQPPQNIDLQNRDRGRAASVVQMSDIARNPDYMRLGPSRTPDSGAPMVFAVGDQLNLEPQAMGREDVAVMSDGQRVPFRYAVVDASRVNPSNFADGSQNPAFNSTTPGTIKALNNGRTAGVRAAHELGTAGEYVEGLKADEAMHGIPADVIARTPNPMLVRVYADADNTAGMAAKSQGQGLGMSPAELARQDAPLMDSSVLSVYEPGDVTSAGNRDFVRAFMGKLQAAGQDVAGMMTGDGQLSQDGRKRIQAALMQAAYGDSDIVEEMFDSTDTDIKAIGEALKTVAGQWANMRDSAKLGAINPQADITQNLIQAIGLIRKARRDNTMVFDLVNQPDLMTGEVPDATTVGVLRMFYSGQYMTRAVGKDKLTKSLGDYVTGAMATSADAGMFGDVVTAGDILATINAAQGIGNAETQPQEGSGEPAGSSTAGRGAGEERGRRPGAGEGGAGVDSDRRSQPGQDAEAQAQQQAGQGDQGAKEGDGAAAASAGAGQQEGADKRAAATGGKGRARKADSEAVTADEAQRNALLAQSGITPLGRQPTRAEYEAVADLIQVGTVLKSLQTSPEITSKVVSLNKLDDGREGYQARVNDYDGDKPRRMTPTSGGGYYNFFVRDGRLYKLDDSIRDDQGRPASKLEYVVLEGAKPAAKKPAAKKAAKPEPAPQGAPTADEKRQALDESLRAGTISVEEFMNATGLTDEDVGTFSGGLRQEADRIAKERSPYHQALQKIYDALSDQMRKALDAAVSTPPQRKAKEERIARINRDRDTLDMIARGFEHPFNNRFVTKLSPGLKERFGPRFDKITTGFQARDAFNQDSYNAWAELLIEAANKKPAAPVRETAPAAAAEPLLTAPTAEEVVARQDAAEAAQREAEAADRKAAEEERKRQEREEIRRRSEAAADTFELGQDPMSNLTGQQDIFAAAPAPAVSANTVFTEDAAARARERLKQKLGRLNSGLDPEMMMDGITLAGYHIEKGARTFAAYARAMMADLGDGVRPYLKSWYMGVKYDPRAAKFDGMDDAVTVESADIDALIAQENQDVPGADGGVESDRGDAAAERAVGDAVPTDAGGTAGEAGADGGSAAGRAGRRQQGGARVPTGGSAAGGNRGDFVVPGGNATADAADVAAGADFRERGGDIGVDGVSVDPVPAAQVDAVAETGNDKLSKLERQRAAEKVAVKPGDLDNIKATLPYLLQGQQEDVKKAEDRFAVPDGYGMLFTNGTGTGKTFTGLGVVKRLQRQGKTNTLIVVPDDKIAADWIESGEPLGLKITKLKDTQDAGKGIVITTYANLGENDSLARRQWDVVVTDEAHTLMQSADGKVTTYLANLRAITHHPDGASRRHSMLYREDIDKLRELSDRIDGNTKILNNPDTMDEMMVSVRAENEKLQREADALAAKIRETSEAVKKEVADMQGAKRARLLALSATPFAYEFTVDWGNGYLFDYNEGQASDKTEFRGYNQGSNRDRFFMQHFGYSMRYNKLTKPDPTKVDTGLLQRNFNGWLRKKGSLSARMLDVPADYDRRFVLVDSGIGNQIDDALNWVSDMSREGENKNGFSALREVINQKFDYLSRRYLLEAIKASEVVPIVRQHMAMGRKVVVFHDYKKGGGFNPFDIPVPGKAPEDFPSERAADFEAYKAALREFRAKFKTLVNAPLGQLDSPIEVFKREFSDVLLVNGDEKKADLLARYKRFQDDESGPQVMLVQSAKNKGWSGHDTTGKHQRVLINLGQPTAPTLAIQQEGRIYRTGQVSDAIMRYLNTGTNWEKWTFATTIAGRASTAENLGMGEQARALKDSFIAAFEESDAYPPGHEGEGKGGKERDKLANAAITAYDRAKTYYWATQKKNSKTKAQEGVDYFATPEPVGFKMAEWLGLRGGESSLEPSAGHGAIARWLPEISNRTVIEPSSPLRSRLAMAMDASKDRIVDGTFEDHAIVNKYDGIAMNPPFGVGGKTAIEHLAKAANHLRDGGRIVALIPTGPAADKRFDQWMYGTEQRPVKPVLTDEKLGAIYPGDTIKSRASWASEGKVVRSRDGALMVKVAGKPGETMVSLASVTEVQPTGARTREVRPADGIYTVGEIRLPQVTFERAGTAVATRIVILEKQTDKDKAPNARSPIDLTDITDIKELFDRLEDISMPARGMSPEQEAAARIEQAAPQVKEPKADKPKAANPEAVGTVERGELPIVEHITQKGKKILGVIRTDLTKEQAQAIDPYTWKKDGGYFIRKVYLKGDDTPMMSRTADSQTETPEFKRWFGDSKVVDAEGRPLVMYHGTMRDFDAFDPDAPAATEYTGAKAIYVSPETRFANDYADGGGGNVMPVYVKATNPFDFENAEHVAALEAYEKANRYTERSVSNFVGDVKRGDWEAIESRKVQAAIKAMGHDGFYLIESGVKNLGVYSPIQIKSAIGNNGQFDPANPDIRASRGTAGSMTETMVRQVADTIAARWTQAPTVVVVQDMQDMRVPEAARLEDARQRAAGATGVPRGFYSRGTVYLVADGLKSVSDAAEALFHEALGHYGLRAVFGAELVPILDQIAMARPDLMRKKAAEYGKDLTVLKQRREVAEEVLAEMAQTKPELGFVKRAIAAIRTWLRKNVPALKDMALTDAEIINSFILPARGWVERGGAGQPLGGPIRFGRTQENADPFMAIAAALTQYAEAEGAFQFGRSQAKDIETVTQEVGQGKVQVEPEYFDEGDHHFKLYVDGKKIATMSLRPASKTVEVNTAAAKADGGGKAAMAVAYEWAYNNGYRVVPNGGLTKINTFRWTESMLSAALRHGTTDHMRPEQLDQRLTGWSRVSDTERLLMLLRRSYENTIENTPSLAGATFNQATGQFLERGGNPLGDDKIREALGKDDVARSRGIGLATFKKALVIGAALQGNSDAGALANALVSHGNVAKLPGLLYSRSTLGNTPPTPPQNPNAWQKLKARALELVSPEAITNLIYELQDKNIDLKNLRDHIKELGGTITDLNDAYLGEELYHKRLAKRTQDFLSEELKPLLADLRARGLDLATLERFLHARHAPEANKVLAERNPNAQMIDAGRTNAKQTVRALEVQLQQAQARGTATKAIEQALEQARDELSRWMGAQAFKGTEAERLSLSGMSDAEAKAVMDGLAPGQRVHLDALAARVDAMNAKTLDTLEKYGLADKAQLDGWRSAYQFYVPLHRDEAHPDAVSHPIGQGFSTKGDAAKRRTGSNEKVTNILAHIAMQREAALTRGEKNRVAKKLYLMAAQNPDPEVWTVDKPPMTKTVDRETGFVRTGVDPTYKNKPNVVMVRVGGKDQAIVFNERNPTAVRMAQSIKSADLGDLNAFDSTMGKATRWLASVNTQYNPIFGLINFARDVQAAILQLSTTPLKGQERAVAANIPAALKGIYSEVRSRRGGQGRGQGQWAKLWEEMQDEGGTTGYRELFIDPAERVKALTKELKALDRGQAAEAAYAVVDWLSDYNETMENAVRLAAYKVALDQGMSKERAASLAKNLTVNFNRRGRQTAKLGAYYAFLNAAIQGTARMVETLRGPTGKKIMLGGVMLGAVNTLIAMTMMGGGEDDDNWEKIPEFVKERSIIIPLSREDYLAIPMPLGYHVLPNMGRKAVEMMLHNDPTMGAGKHVTEMLRLMLDAFNPLGGSSNMAQMLTPTPLDPAIALIQNRDWTGKPIYREDNSNLDPTPGHTRTKDTASTFSKAVSEALVKITGGTDYQPGAINWTPDQIDYIIGQLTGGLGRELMKVEQTITAPFTGEELPPHKIPLAGRIYGNTSGPASESEKFYENLTKLNGVEREIKGRARDGEDYETYMAEEPLADLVGLGNSAQNQISKLRQARREVVRQGLPGYQDEVKDINGQIGDVMKTVNQEVRRAKQEARP